MKRLYGHVAYRDEETTLCGGPKGAGKGPAFLYCGKCVAAIVANSQKGTLWTFRTIHVEGTDGAA